MNHAMLLRGGHVVDPSLALDGVADIRIRDGLVVELGQLEPAPGELPLDLSGLVVAPGFIDVHTHLREPGQEWKETLATGTAAAAAGGFATVFCMPNTTPALDSVVMLDEFWRRVRRDAVVRSFPIGTISEGRRGRQVVDYDAMARAGAVGFSDDGDSTIDSGVMRAALEASRRLNLPVMVHCEDHGLLGGSMSEGETSRLLSLRGLPAIAEEIMIERDMLLAKATGGWLHVLHVSTDWGARRIAQMRQARVHVTAEVMPHHLVMADDWVAGRRDFVNGAIQDPSHEQSDPDTKVNPPLRTREDARGLIKALRGGVFDLVSTDHAPHAMIEKQGRTFGGAAFGMSASEFALPTMLTFVRDGTLSMSEMVRLMCTAPARMWRLPTGSLAPGRPADVVAFDPNETWTPERARLVSRSTNTPLLGVSLQGKVKLTLVGGDIRFRDGC
jgi:dihydroorotase